MRLRCRQTELPLLNRCARRCLQGAEKDVQQDVKSEVKSAVKEAIEEAVASDQLLTGSRKGTKLMHTLVKDAGNAAAKAGAQEEKEYSAEMSHITNELDSQLGGLVSLRSTRNKGNPATSSSRSPAAVGKGHKDWVSLATKVLRRQEHTHSGWRHEHSDTKKQVERAIKEKKQYAKEEQTINLEASYQDGKIKKDVPFGSRKNPMYVRAEHKRDSEADEDFKKLENIREVKEARKKHAKRRQHLGEDRTAVANKYLKVMENPVVPKIVQSHADRNELAAKYLHQLVKEKPEIQHR